MKKIVSISGMTCAHCQKRVEDALNAIAGVEAKVDLKKNDALVKSAEEVDNSLIRQAVEKAGYDVISIKEKKGFF